VAPETPGTPHVAPRPFVSPYAYEHYVRAELLRARGRDAEAAEAYRMALSSSEDDAYLLARLAEAADAAGDAAGSDAALATALALDPRSEAAWLARGRIAERRERWADAIAAYERAELAAPASAEATRRLAALLLAKGARERALAVLERSSRRGPADEERALQARLELALLRDDGAQLEAAAAELLARGEGAPELLRRTAAELLAVGKAALAARALFRVPLERADARLRLDVALARADRGGAEKLLTDLPADWLGGTLEVARAYVELGLWQSALARLDERERAADDDESLRALLAGRCLAALGRHAEAARRLATVPEGSVHRAAAQAQLAGALRGAGLSSLAAEVQR
jgi:tetratricopeptide (TPR) repeat protein